MPNETELAQCAHSFLQRVDLKGIEARRLVEVLHWLEAIIETGQKQPPRLRAIEPENA